VPEPPLDAMRSDLSRGMIAPGAYFVKP